MKFIVEFAAVVLCALTVSGSSAAAADTGLYVLRGADLPADNGGVQALSQDFEFGTRVWYSTGEVAKTLYATPGSGLGVVSRLTYRNLDAYTSEAFGRISIGGWAYIRGDAGYSGLGQGSLQDEDFEPLMDPYSSTLSAQRNGSLHYATLDYGVKVLQDAAYRLFVFVGANNLNETASAYGCVQTATNPYVCAPGDVAPGALAITQNTRWISARLGVSGDVLLSDRLRLSVQAAWLPYTWFNGLDTHWLRTDIGPTTETGHGRNGVQIEAVADYQLTTNLSLGAGVRYWRLMANPDATLVDPSGIYLGTQPEAFMTQRYGAFLQAAYQF